MNNVVCITDNQKGKTMKETKEQREQRISREGTLWTATTAIQVVAELQKALMVSNEKHPGANKELAAAVILRLSALTGELATDFALPAWPIKNEEVEQLLELAEKAGWA